LIDYLETIRKQDSQIKLFSQILDKVQACIRRDCNYANINRIKLESVWDEDLQKWRLPELVVTRTKLPPPPASHNGIYIGGREPATSVIHHSNTPTNQMNSLTVDENDSSPPVSPEDRLFEKLEKGAQEDIVSTYFKPKRMEQLLSNVNRVKICKHC
jgi:kinesin family member 17